MAKEIDIRFPAREGHDVLWRLTEGQIATLTRKYGDAALRQRIVPKIRARVRSWYGKRDRSAWIWSVNIDRKTSYDLRTGKFKKRA